MRAGDFSWRSATLIGAIGLATLAGCDRAGKIGQVPGPKVVVVSQAEEPAEGRSDVLVCHFTLANEGGEALKLGAITTSCGCTLADVIPKTVPPGGTAILSAKGHPPVTGTTPVQIRVDTNDTGSPTLTLKWNLVGNPKPPALLSPSPVVELGVLRPGRAIRPRSFGFDVMEMRENLPIVQSVRFDPSFCRVEGGVTDEVPANDPRFMKRSYRYQVNFLSNPEQGQISQQVELLRTSDEAIPWMVVPIRGRVLPVVRAVPSSLTLVDRKIDPNASAKLMIVCDEPSAPLVVECIDHDPVTVVRVVERHEDRVFFEVYREETGDHAASRTIHFRVSQPVKGDVEVSIESKNKGKFTP